MARSVEQSASVASVADVVTDAASALIDEYEAFWLLSATTDCSFEEGDRAGMFRRCAAGYDRVGLPPAYGAQLRSGVNGLLADGLRARVRDDCKVQRNKW